MKIKNKSKKASLFLVIIMFCALLLNISNVYASSYDVLSDNIWTDGEYLYMGMEDGVMPFFHYHRGTETLNSTSEINGTYCIRIGYNGSSGALTDTSQFDNRMKPNSLSIKVKINETGDEPFSIQYAQSTTFYAITWKFGSHVEGSNMSQITMLTKNDVGSAFYHTFNEFTPCKNDTVYTLNVTNINYAEGTASSITVSNETHSQTINNVWLNGWQPVYGNEIVDISDIVFSGSNPNLAYDYVYFADDWTVGTQARVDTLSPYPLGHDSARMRANLVNDGSTFQNGTQDNHTIQFFWDNVSCDSLNDYSNNITVSGFYTGDTAYSTLSGLTPETTYYYKVYIQNNYTNASSYWWGDEVSFTTTAVPPPTWGGTTLTVEQYIPFIGLALLGVMLVVHALKNPSLEAGLLVLLVISIILIIVTMSIINAL